MEPTHTKANKLNLIYTLLIPLVLGINIFSLYEFQRIAHQNQDNTVQILNNQFHNSTTLEGFFRGGLVCIFTIPPNPAASKTLITNEVDNCFKNTPQIK
jgi:hypothetical protein